MTAVSIAVRAEAQDWETVDFIQHSTYQAVDNEGDSTYTEPVPFRMRGVVLNNTEDWLDATENYNEIPWNLAGEAEIFVQAVDMDGTSWDPDPVNSSEDFGGTAAWMGQCSGNLGFIDEPAVSYIDVAMAQPGETRPVWYNELDRLGFNRPGTPLGTEQIVRAGDLVELQARVNGLNYMGKHNVNERHDNITANNYEVVILEKGFGLPTPTIIALADVKDAANAHIFDSTRASGGELYQSTLVKIENVRFMDSCDWGTESDLVLTDETDRTLNIHLGLNDSFLSSAPEGWFNVVGIMDQKDSTSGMGGYRLLAMNASDFEPVLPGDFDIDDDVDGADFLLWQRGIGTDYGVSDLADWQFYFGTTPVTAAVHLELVPEPAALAVLASGVLMLLAGRCRIRRRMT